MKALESIPVVILCGGKGVRLGPISQHVPKPLVRIGGMPIVRHVMASYARFGSKRFILCLGYKKELFEEYFSAGTIDGEPVGPEPAKEPDWTVELVDTGLETGTSGRLHRIKERLVESDCSFMTYGDGVSSLSIAELLAFHRARGKLATVTGVHPPTSFGIIEDEDGLVARFVEKPRLQVIVNGGFFVLGRGALSYLDEDGPFEVGPLYRLTAAKQLAVFRHEGFWQCMDTEKEMKMLNEMWDRGERPWAAQVEPVAHSPITRAKGR